jgi:hypothetical protein
MVNLKSTAVLIITGLVLQAQVFAQEMTSSIIHQISKKASKGELYDYLIDEDNNSIELAYLLKETNKTMFMETYIFKLSDLSFISSNEEEVKKEKVKYKRTKWGRNEPTKLLKLTPNFITGNIVLKRGYISYGYAGRAVITSFVSDDRGIKVRTQGGDKFIYLDHQTESRDLSKGILVSKQSSNKTGTINAAGTFGWGFTSIGEGNVSIIGMEKSKPYYSKYAFTIYDAKTRTEILYKTIDLKYSYSPISAKYLPNGNIGVVFWPIQTDLLPTSKGVAEKFNCDPNKNFKYIEINTVGEKITDVNFQLEMGKKGGQYNFDIIPSYNKKELVLLGVSRPDYYGAGTMMNPKYIAPSHAKDTPIVLHKAEKAIVIRIANNEVMFIKETPIENFTESISTTEDTKKPKTETLLQGYKASQAMTDENGDMLIYGIGDIHKVIQIDQEGNIKVYMDKQDQDWAQVNELIQNKAGEVYWVKFDMDKYDASSNDDMLKSLHDRTGNISKLNTQKGEIVQTISLTPEGATLDEQEPVRWINENEFLVLGSGKKKEISLSKIKLN